MKIRSGFVSNSSSSSFLMVGIKVNNDDIEKLLKNDDKKFGTDDWNLTAAVYHKYGLSVHEDGSDTYVGGMRFTGEEDTNVMDLTELTAGNFHLSKILEDLDGDGDDHKIKLITGVTYH